MRSTFDSMNSYVPIDAALFTHFSQQILAMADKEILKNLNVESKRAVLVDSLMKTYHITIYNTIDKIKHIIKGEALRPLFDNLPAELLVDDTLTITEKFRIWFEDDEIKILERKHKQYNEAVPIFSNRKDQVPRYSNKWSKAHNRMGYTWRKNTAHRKSV